MFGYDVRQAYATASGVLYNTRTRVQQVSFVGNGTAGTITLYDNPSAGSGNILFQWAFGTADTQTVVILIPGDGILALTGVYATITNVSALSVMYG